jgi:predicted dehydrogenase
MSLSRRTFLEATAAAGFIPRSAWGANGKVQVGFLGVGIRGYQLLQRTVQNLGDGVQVVAVADTYKGWLQRGVNTAGGAPAAYDDYRRLLDDKNVEAVVIGTPEHRHVEHVIAALQAGKDVYVEKPLSHTIEEGDQMLKALEKAGGPAKRIVQVGTQRRSSPLYFKARDMVKAGMLGKVTCVRAFWYRNSPRPQWRYPIPDDASPETCNWQAFLGPAKKRAWDPARYFQWRLYWDYSGGIATDLMTHQIDAVQLVLGETAPESVIAMGNIFHWKDGREVPDTFHAALTYRSGFSVDYTSMFANQRYGYGEQFMGTEGTLEVMNLRTLSFYPEKLMDAGKDVTPDHVKARAELTIEAKDLDPTDVTVLHLRDFYDAVRTRRQPNCPLEVGDQAAVPCHLATLALQRKRQVTWRLEA